MDKADFKKILLDSERRWPLIGWLWRRFFYMPIWSWNYRRVRGKGNRICMPFALQNAMRIDIIGNNNEVVFGPYVRLHHVTIFIRGNGNRLSIGAESRFERSAQLWLEGEGNTIEIGKGCSFENTHIAVTEKNGTIRIGDDCMFAYDIDVRNGDSHSIVHPSSGKRLNPSRDVTIGDHVWIASHCSILKGSQVPSGCIVATRSCVTRSFSEPNALIVGTPARVVATDRTWQRELIPSKESV